MAGQLDRGELIPFARGPEGAHQVQNQSDQVARVLMLSEMNAPELIVYPDSEKVGVLSRVPGSLGDEDEPARWFTLDDAVDYWRGERRPDPD